MDINSLSDAEKAALAKAQAAGVTLVNKDGSSTNISDQTPKVAPPASASGDVAPGGTKPAAADVKPGEKPADTGNTGNKPQRPEWCPEKFWNAETGAVNQEAMAKSYAELQTKLGTAKAPDMGAGDPAKAAAEAAARDAAAKPASERTPEEQKLAAEKEAADKAAAEAAVTKARADAVQAATAEIQRDGKLSEQTYQQLAKAGYDKATVDAYIDGQKAQATLIINSMHDMAGGKEAFEQKVAWGSANYSIEEQTAFNNALRSGDKGQITLAVQGLNARYAAEFGKGGKTVETKGGTPAGNAFASQAELQAAMSDARYAKDAAYRAQVAERIAASQRQGIDIGIRIQK